MAQSQLKVFLINDNTSESDDLVLDPVEVPYGIY